MSQTVEEWREFRMPHFTACEAALHRFLDTQISRVAQMLEFKRESFQYSARIKGADSAARTAARTGVEFWKLNDWLGVRLSCPTLESAYYLSVVMGSFDGWDWKLVSRHDHNLEPELDGYRGIHVCGECVRSAVDASDNVRINCEVQLHTRLQTVWVDLTHDDVYKPTRPVSAFVHDTAATLAAYMAATDQLFERTLKTLRDPEGQLQPVGDAEIRQWISVLAMLDPSSDYYAIEELAESLRTVGIRTAAQLESLRSRYSRLVPSIDQAWQQTRKTEPTAAARVAYAGRLIGERVRLQDIDRKLTEWLLPEEGEPSIRTQNDGQVDEMTDGE